MLRFRRVHGDAELAAYREAYYCTSGYWIERAFLARTLVYGAYDHRGLLRGGFVANTEAPFRYLERIPAQPRRAVRASLVEDDLMELTGVWMDARLRSGVWSAVFWVRMFIEGSSLGKPLVLFGTEVPAIRRLYEAGRPMTLYEGPVQIDGHTRHGSVYSNPCERRWPYLALVMRHKVMRPVRRALTARASSPPFTGAVVERKS